MRSQRGTGVCVMSGRCGALINGLQPSALQVGHDLRHDFLGLAENEVPDFRERLVAGGEQRPAGDDGFSQRRATRHDFAHGILLHDHRAQQNIIRPAQVFVLEPFHVQVHQLEFPFRRQHGGHRQQTQRRHGGLAGNKADGVFETPKRVRRPGADEQNIHIAM